MNIVHPMESTIRDRIEEISRLIFEVANGNFAYKIPSSPHDTDELEAIILGVNMLGQELRKSTVSRDYMKRIYDGVIDILIIMDANLKIKAVNNAACDLLGYQEDELIGKPLEQLLSEDSKSSPFVRVVEDLARLGQSKNKELNFVSRNGYELPTSTSFSTLENENEEEKEVMIIAKDISQLKATELALRKARDQAEEANRSKGRFLSNMSHEIRTPLNGILGFSELLKNTAATKMQKEYLSLIHSSGETLAKLLNDVLDLNKMDLDKLVIEKVPFDFRYNVDSNLHPYKYLAKEKNLTFDFIVEESVPEIVISDPTRINQIIINFVSNSMKFTEDGSIHLKFKGIRREGMLLLHGEVIDTGIGVAHDKRDTIFETFTQSDSSTTRKYGGSGLGLAICKQLVGLMDGQIGVDSPISENQQGSRFWFTIPIEAGVKPEKSAKDHSENNFKLKENKNILVVDDNNVNLLLIKKMLMSAGAKVTSAIHGKDAIEKVQSKDFDMIFMDIQMPVMDGFDATIELRKQGYEKPILALSANVDKENIEKCLTVGMNDYLQKPYHKKQLMGLLEKWASN